MPPAANIDQAIAMSAANIAALSYGGVTSLYTRMNSWMTGMFSQASGIFKPSANPGPEVNEPGQRVITDWYAQHFLARAAIEGQAAGQSGLVGTSEVINAVVRVLYAVKYAVIAGRATSSQQTAVVTLYNASWQ
jgi:hypothetical protein